MPTQSSTDYISSHFLSSCRSFQGSQRVSQSQVLDDWTVKVKIQSFNHLTGRINGVMEASNIPSLSTPVVTFWEGEVIDGHNHGFFTKKWRATQRNDIVHWGKLDGFHPGFLTASKDELAAELCAHDYVFMRWKEQFFVNVGQECGLTIAGFYYMCLNKNTGDMAGYYFDPESTPFQQLLLEPTSGLKVPPTFAEFQFA